MKPSSEENDGQTGRIFFPRRTGPRFPVTDCNFQTLSLDRYHGGSAGSSPTSFLNISREYFRHEARRSLVVEIAFFLVIAAVLTVTFISDARVIVHFLHLPTA